MVGLAVSVGVQTGTTTAIMDGDANVVGNINVTAKNKKDAVPIQKLFAFPSTDGGVIAQAGTGTNSKGDLADDIQGAGVSKLIGNRVS